MTAGGIIIMVAQFLLSLSLLIILHEWGHYYPAKLFKTKVEKFYLFFDAFGKSLFKKKIGETEYGIGWLPLGGYVKIAGMIDESMDKEQMKQEPQPWEFRSKKPWQRLVIMLGGVTVNFVLAYLIFVFMSFTWGDKFIATEDIKGGIIVPEFVEEQIGLKTGDKVLTINGEKPESFSEIRQRMLFKRDIVVEREGKKVNLTVPEDFLGNLVDTNAKKLIGIYQPLIVTKISDTSVNKKSSLKLNDIFVSINHEKVYMHNISKVFDKNKSDEVLAVVKDTLGNLRETKIFLNEKGSPEVVLSTLGLDKLDSYGYYKVTHKQYNFLESFAAGGRKVASKVELMIDNIKAIGNPKTGAYKGVGSFVSIAKIFPTSWDWQVFWSITAFLSIMLGVLNLLPIPALDGGHAVFVIYEMITKRKPGEKFMEYMQMTGFVIMMIIFVYAFGNDIYRHFIK